MIYVISDTRNDIVLAITSSAYAARMLMRSLSAVRVDIFDERTLQSMFPQGSRDRTLRIDVSDDGRFSFSVAGVEPGDAILTRARTVARQAGLLATYDAAMQLHGKEPSEDPNNDLVSAIFGYNHRSSYVHMRRRLIAEAARRD